MLIQKLQLLKIPDTLEVSLDYIGAERWVCWYWDNQKETLIIEDKNSSYFGNGLAWLLFSSYVDANKTLNKSNLYNYFERLASGQYPYKEAYETETKVTENLSSFNTEKAYLFDRQTRELYSGSPSDVQTLIKQPKVLVMWAELQSGAWSDVKFDQELTLLKPIEEELALFEPKSQNKLLNARLFKMALVCFACGVFLSIPLASAINIPQSISRFFLPPPPNSAEKLKTELAQLALENQTAELLTQEQPLKVAKKQKSECKTQPVNK